MIKKVVRLFLSLLLVMLCTTSHVRAQDRTLVFGVHPYLGAEEIIKRFAPLIQFLEHGLGMSIVLKVGSDYQEHINEIGNDKLDIALLGPASYVEMAKIFGEKPFLAKIEKNGSSMIYGQIIVSNTSSIRSIRELEGKSFAFGDPHSTLSSLVPRALLKQNGISLEKLAFSKHFDGHINVAYAVLSGEMDAGAVKDSIFEKFKQKGLRSIAQTPKFSEHPFVTRSDLEPELIHKLRLLMQNLHNSTECRAILHAINPGITALVDVQDSDYDSLRQVLFASDK
ncbi:MAG: phosphate/phosphite/phosphonate ABC transporter substrate-binding protein [Gammaproteobacteria bacterium]|nr:phosphate/phosphite/phosphonate ABC transporter substrate-binding protein [Gammaproteobacteria bacterium]